MVQFWLDNFNELINLDNFKTSDTDSPSDAKLKNLNKISIVVVVLGLIMSILKKDTVYFGFSIIVLSVIILTKNTLTQESFENTSNKEEVISKTKLSRDHKKDEKLLYVDSDDNFKEGDIIFLVRYDTQGNELDRVVNILLDKQLKDGSLVLLLKQPLGYDFTVKQTGIIKSKSGEVLKNLRNKFDPNMSIRLANTPVDLVNKQPENNWNTGGQEVKLTNENRSDYNFEQSTLADKDFKYEYQGQPNNQEIKCRRPTVNNPMGTINVTEYGQKPTMYGTCNVADEGVRNEMEKAYEATVAMEPFEQMFHLNNAQSRFSPMPIDTIPNQQDQFAFFCYQQPSNMINPKYGSIFAYEPDKFKFVTKLAKATGTENGGF